MVGLLLLLWGCSSSPTTETMSDKDLLVRTSLDLRGIRPTVQEYEALEADPNQLDTLIDSFMQDVRFEGRVSALFSEIYLTRTEAYSINADSYGGVVTQADFVQSIGQEAIRMVGHVAAQDRPWTDLVQGNWTMTNETLGAIWPVTYPDNQQGWTLSEYTDGRPGAGILSTNSMWWRYDSTFSNANRKRANQISRIFLCNDYLLKKIEFDRNVNLLDQESIDDALAHNPACINCHSSLDPLASYLYGFWYLQQNNAVDLTHYHPEREQTWKRTTGIAPAYYGEPGFTLRDLGQQIAKDNQFIRCAVQQSWELLLRRDASTADIDSLIQHREVFLSNALTIKPLFRSIIDTPEYRAGRTDEPGMVSKKMVTPSMLASEIEHLTGFQWTLQGYDVMASDTFGFLTLAGGADGYYTTAHATQPNATLILVQERLAEAAALYVTQRDADPTHSEKTLFEHIDFTETPEDNRARMITQIQALHFRIFGTRVAPDGEEVNAGLELWTALHAIEHEPQRAWAGLLSALLREPALLFY